MLLNKLKIAMQYVLPQHMLSRALGFAAELEARAVKNRLIKLFIHRFRVDMSDAIEEDPEKYPSFNAFFTRALKPGARPIDPEHVVAPADGVISQFGTISEGTLIQAKGRMYNLLELLGGNREWSKPFEGGSYMTLYLAPFNYHRVHMPLRGMLEKMIYIPGCLFSVNQHTANHVPNLFTRNERVVSIFNRRDKKEGRLPADEVDQDAMGVVLVGAMVVGGIHTVWAGQVSPPHRRSKVMTRYYQNVGNATVLDKGQQMGHFSVGSTAIILFGKGAVEWLPELKEGQSIKMGEPIGVQVER